VDMGHEELKEIGIHAFGHRHKILKAVKEKLSGLPELGELFCRVGLGLLALACWPWLVGLGLLALACWPWCTETKKGVG